MTDPIQPIAQHLAQLIEQQDDERIDVGAAFWLEGAVREAAEHLVYMEAARRALIREHAELERLRRDVAELERQRNTLAADVAARDSRIEDLEAKVELARMLMGGKLRAALAATQQKESSDE